MNITDELERLGKLHQDGTLNDEEFALAKRRLLNQPVESEPSEFAPGRPDNSLGEAANRYVTFQMIMGAIGFIIVFIFFCAFILPHMGSGHSFR